MADNVRCEGAYQSGNVHIFFASVYEMRSDVPRRVNSHKTTVLQGTALTREPIVFPWKIR